LDDLIFSSRLCKKAKNSQPYCEFFCVAWAEKAKDQK
jgi:hypothetical protein